MNYEFPTIGCLDDVLPHVAGRKEFVVSQRSGYTAVMYRYLESSTFDMAGPDDLGGAIRRECRGLLFDEGGTLISRPFHKFFNIGEREETLPRHIDIQAPHSLMEKLDGSMVRPVIIGGQLRLATKMGITDYSAAAEEWLKQRGPEPRSWMMDVIRAGYTPIFEWVSRANRIVVEYEQADLVLLALRDMLTGQYEALKDIDCPLSTVRTYGPVAGGVKDYVQRVRDQRGVEGDVLTFANGHRVKIKSTWYVQIHKALEDVRSERRLVQLTLSGALDDVIPLLPPDVVHQVYEFQDHFWECVNAKHAEMSELCESAKRMDRKSVALSLLKGRSKYDRTVVFLALDDLSVRDAVMTVIGQNQSPEKKWQAVYSWLRTTWTGGAPPG